MNQQEQKVKNLLNFIMVNYGVFNKFGDDFYIDLDTMFKDYLFNRLVLSDGITVDQVKWFLRYNHQDYKFNLVIGKTMYKF